MSTRAERRELAAVRQRIADEARQDALSGAKQNPTGLTMVEVYALRWGNVSRGEDGRWYRFRPGCLAGSRPIEARVLAEHGRKIDSDEPSELLSEPVGQFTDARVDEVGLLTVARYDDTPLARDTVAAIRSGVLAAYSAHLRIFETVDTGEVRGGLPVLDVVRAQLVEAGPTHDPVDPGAVIVSIGSEHLRAAYPSDADPPECASLDDALTYLASVSGLSITVDDVADQHRRIDQAARQQARDADWLASQLGKARRAAEQAYRGSRASWSRPDDLTRARHLETEADDLEADLRELLYDDRAMVADYLARFNVPPKVSPLERIKGLAQ